jgi:D-alanine-D-alanine ligase
MKNIVLISDRVKDYSQATILSRYLEFADDKYFNSLYNSLCSIAPHVFHYSTPKGLINNVEKHANDVVINIWSGEYSRNRKALIQSICEGYNIPYVGADSYLQIIASDKHLSKVICKPFGIYGAEDVIISKEDDFWLIKTLKFPIIVKPNNEGGSIGIFQENVVFNYNDAVKICKELLSVFPILIAEEYLPGEEISICIAGINGKIDIFEAVRQKLGEKDYFTYEIFGAESKKIDKTKRIKEVVTNKFPKDEKAKLISLYNSLGKAEIIRIDGRLSNNAFNLIELTPDCSLNITGSISIAFDYNGYTYAQMLTLLLNNAIEAWECQNANM